MRADISAKGKGTGNKILFLFRSLSNFCSISLKVIISGPTHSIIFEELLFEISVGFSIKNSIFKSGYTSLI